MTPTPSPSPSALAALWRRLLCHWQAAQRRRQDLQALSEMDTYALRDLGITHAAVAAAANFSNGCR